MESYIQISKINDFLYSPKSLYLHSVYESFNQDMYHESPQKIGKLNHECIEKGEYSSAKKWLQGILVYSEKYNLGGKIDLYNKDKKTLIERKTKIRSIYDGHRFQLYAQMFALEEMGYEVEEICIHSLDDNIRYKIKMPDEKEIKRFEDTLYSIRHFDLGRLQESQFKCDVSIYRHLSY